MLLKSCAIAILTFGGIDDPPAADPMMDSLARTTGDVTVAGLSAPVHIERDGLGIPVIRGASLEDVLRGLGFVHAQERFFQMDLLRRNSAGRLAELIGGMGLGMDQRARAFQFEAVADAVVARQPDDMRRMMEAYAAGVNAGLDDLRAPPPEYAFTGAAPAPWAERDTVLVLLSMFQMLSSNAAIERPLGVMHETLPPALVRFLTPMDTRFESPLMPGDGAVGTPPLPSPDIVDLRTRGAWNGSASPETLVATSPVALGSNNWAVAGGRTTHGGAILANDPHLRISVPGIWFRAELEWSDGHAFGLSLPGSPGVLIGSNTNVAWGFTNTQADFQDLVVVEVDPEDPGRYRTPEGSEPFEEVNETIDVRGGAPVAITLRKTRWGIVTGEDGRGRPIVLKWTALEPSMVNMGIVRMMSAASLEDAIDVARTWYGPSQNVLIADRAGRIGWIVSGYFPRRVGFDGTVPVSWARSGVGWRGPMDESDRPTIVDPPEGILYTANNRTVDVAWARRLGNDWDLGARARRIGALLREAKRASETDLLAIQLDTRVEMLDFYRDLVLEVVVGGEDEPMAVLREARRTVDAWNGTAAIDQAAMPILDGYRRALHAAVTAPLVAPCRAVDPRFRYRWMRAEEPVRKIIESRAAHLRPPGSREWKTFLRETLRRVVMPLAARRPDEVPALPWGDVNQSAIRHPMAQAAPQFSGLLNMADAPLPGHPYAVRVATSSYGASMRMVVSPGREADGLLHIPSGQSGHPMSPHYRDSHPAWLEGRPTPFRAGASVGAIVLQP